MSWSFVAYVLLTPPDVRLLVEELFDERLLSSVFLGPDCAHRLDEEHFYF